MFANGVPRLTFLFFYFVFFFCVSSHWSMKMVMMVSQIRQWPEQPLSECWCSLSGWWTVFCEVVKKAGCFRFALILWPDDDSYWILGVWCKSLLFHCHNFFELSKFSRVLPFLFRFSWVPQLEKADRNLRIDAQLRTCSFKVIWNKMLQVFTN